MNRRLAAGVVLCIALAGTASASPLAGTVEVRDQAGAVVDVRTGPDALRDALGVIGTLRGPDTRPWSVVVGAGTYGDAVVGARNVTVVADPPGGAIIRGTGGTDDTGGGCLDVTRGPVTVDGIACQAPSRTGINVTLPNAEGGVLLRAVSVDAAGVDGVAATGGTGITLDGVVVSRAKRDGIRLTSLTGPGPYTITGGSIAASGRDGLRLADDVTRLAVTGLGVTGSTGYGVASEDAGTADITLSGLGVSGSGKDGVLVRGGGLRIALHDLTATGNAGAGVRLGDASGLRVHGLALNGSNAGGDLVFTSDPRTGGAYGALSTSDGTVNLVGEPSAVRLSGVPPSRASVAAGSPLGRRRAGATLLVGATTRTSSRRIVLRFPISSSPRVAVWRRAGAWTSVPSSRRVRGGLQVVLGTSLLGTASTAYAPFG